jgi:hypothetical protein
MWTQRRKFSTAEAWIDLLLRARGSVEARYVEIQSTGEHVREARGQLVTSYRELSRRWCWSVNRVRRYIKRNSKRNEERNSLGTETERRWIRLTILNYNDYNPLRNNDGTQDGTQTALKTEQQTEHILKEGFKRRLKEGKEKTELSSAGARLSVDLLKEEYHNEIWPVCPVKIRKQATLQEYIRARGLGVTKEAILKGMIAYAHLERTRPKDSNKLSPDKWFREKRWTDEPPGMPQATPAKLTVYECSAGCGQTWNLPPGHPELVDLRMRNGLCKVCANKPEFRSASPAEVRKILAEAGIGGKS